MTDELLYERRDGIGHVTFNRPGARNALTFSMYESLTEIAADPGDVRALLITGAGDKAFAAGTDINQFRAFSGADDAMAYEARIDRTVGTIERCPVPTIAAIAGACTGGGAAIAAACDLRIATANAQFGFPIARTLGNCLSMSNIARLSALIGPARVLEMILHRPLVLGHRGVVGGIGHRGALRPLRAGGPRGGTRRSDSRSRPTNHARDAGGTAPDARQPAAG